MRSRYLVFTALLCLLAFAPAIAQGQSNCPALVEKALTDLTTNCSEMNRNSACYGFNRVDATFAEATDDTVFSTPADRARLAELQTIETTPLDTDASRWGIAVLNVQANVPNTLPGQAVTFMLLGDVKVDNAVAPDAAFEGVAPVTLTVLTSANVRSGPSVKANVVGSLPVNTELQSDGVSPDSAWLRVLFDGGPAWINRELVGSAADLTSLPVITEENRSPMQAFYFSTGTGSPVCNDAPPSALVVQGPDKVQVDITANGADITIGSTIVLWLLPDGKMQLAVLHGDAEVGGVTIPAGFMATLQLSDDGTEIVGGVENFGPMTPDILASLKPLENIEGDFLHYPIVIPTVEDIEATLQALAALRQTNNSSSTGGQPAGNTGNQGSAQCGGFAPTSPLGNMPFAGVTFYWDPAPGAVTYRMRLYDAGHTLMREFTTTDTNVSVDFVTSTFGGSLFFWQVEALVDGVVVCSAPEITLMRERDPNYQDPLPATDVPRCGNGQLDPGEECNGPYQCFIDNGGC
jgi:hypothetical protein